MIAKPSTSNRQYGSAQRVATSVPAILANVEPNTLPWGKAEFPFLYKLIDFARNLPGEIALSIGGSIASQKNASLSDLDLFFYINDHDVYSIAEQLMYHLASEEAIVTSCPLQHYDCFGCRCSWTLEKQPVPIVELFITSRISLKTTAMAKSNFLIIDRSPSYRLFLAKCATCEDDSTNDTLNLIFHNIVAGASKTRKEIDEGDFIKAANRFFKFRMACLSVLIYARTKQIHHPLVAEKFFSSLDEPTYQFIHRSYELRCLADVKKYFHSISKILPAEIISLLRDGYIKKRQAHSMIKILKSYALFS